jgi:uncharacterized protein (TIGR00251 family)
MRIYVKVKPSSGRQELIKEDKDSYIAYLKSPPEDNKANVELVKLLHNYFKTDVKIKTGLTSSNKIIEIKE